MGAERARRHARATLNAHLIGEHGRAGAIDFAANKINYALASE